MTVAISRLENGLIIASDPMPNLESAAVGIWVGCGARHETKAEMGLSHMLEHMAFKGTERRSAKQIATEIEAVGGEINAYTAREQTAFHARVLKGDVNLALDILADIIVHPAFDEVEIEREREVIIQEIGQARDTPDDLVFDCLQEACYPGQPMGWPIFGSEQSVASFSRRDLLSYMRANYLGGTMMLIASGAVDHARLVEEATRLFSSLPASTGRVPAPAYYKGSEILEHDAELEQAHLAFAFEGFPVADKDAVTAQVFVTALGGGMSSRLFQEARERRGLCYAINAFSQSHKDSGTIGIYAGTSEANAAEIPAVIANEIEAMAAGATEEETARARAQLKASLLMALESPAARCELIAGQLSAYGRVLTMPEITARVDAVDAAALRNFAGNLAERGDPSIAAVGPLRRLESREAFARRFGRLSVAAQ
jgi:predicted Zn-dependent peptidase